MWDLSDGFNIMYISACDTGYWGDNCQGICACKSGTVCSTTQGCSECSDPGFTGQIITLLST